jgi:acyl-CoA synthetase (AMP-forming)/AMP-acid ligase II
MNEETTVLAEDLSGPLTPGAAQTGWLARKAHVPLGYFKDPEKTARTFPVINGQRYAVPGDHAKLAADGSIIVLGRGSVSINSGGEKIYPEEVEQALKHHPAVYDAVVVGTAWHWFDRVRTEPEIARVLRPGGVLVVLWNGDDDTVEWVRGYQRALHPDEMTPVGTTLTDARPHDPAFGRTETRRFANPVPTTIDGFVETIATHSWALIADPRDRDASLARMRAYLAARPETSPGAFTLPMVTDVVRTLRR